MDAHKLTDEQTALLIDAAGRRERCYDGASLRAETLLPGADLVRAGLMQVGYSDALEGPCLSLTTAGWIAWHEIEIARLRSEIAEPAPTASAA